MRKQEERETRTSARVLTATPSDNRIVPEYVPAELNLETIGFFSAGYKRRYPKEPHEAKTVNLGTMRQIRIVPSTYGYPNSEDLDLYRAFLKICDEHAVLETDNPAGMISRKPRLKLPICFSTKKILQYAGYKKNAQILRRVQEWIKRGVITGIEGGIYEAKTKRIREGIMFTLFSKAYLRGELMTDGTIADTNYIWPAEWFCSNYFLRYFRPIDLAFHRRLERPIAKTLYPILETGWYAAKGGIYAKSYHDLCALMFIPRHKQLSLAKQQLDPSHEELRREGFLAAWEYTLDQQSKWNGVIRWWPGPKWFQDHNSHPTQRVTVEQGVGTGVLLEQDSEKYLLDTEDDVVNSENSESLLEETQSYSNKVKEFYARQGQQRVSKEKIKKEAKILEGLEHEGFAPTEIDGAMSWLLQNRQKFGGEIHSLKLLVETIGQSLKEMRKTQRANEQLHHRALLREEDQSLAQNSTEIEMSLGNLSERERKELQGRAVASLLRQGYKIEVVKELKLLVACEMLKLHSENQDGDSRSIAS